MYIFRVLQEFETSKLTLRMDRSVNNSDNNLIKCKNVNKVIDRRAPRIHITCIIS